MKSLIEKTKIGQRDLVTYRLFFEKKKSIFLILKSNMYLTKLKTPIY
jgi:hypothetical protein